MNCKAAVESIDPSSKRSPTAESTTGSCSSMNPEWASTEDLLSSGRRSRVRNERGVKNVISETLTPLPEENYLRIVRGSYN